MKRQKWEMGARKVAWWWWWWSKWDARVALSLLQSVERHLAHETHMGILSCPWFIRDYSCKLTDLFTVHTHTHRCLANLSRSIFNDAKASKQLSGRCSFALLPLSFCPFLVLCLCGFQTKQQQQTKALWCLISVLSVALERSPIDLLVKQPPLDSGAVILSGNLPGNALFLGCTDLHAESFSASVRACLNCSPLSLTRLLLWLV